MTLRNEAMATKFEKYAVIRRIDFEGTINTNSRIALLSNFTFQRTKILIENGKFKVLLFLFLL
jgi:hypothetical protein